YIPTRRSSDLSAKLTALLPEIKKGPAFIGRSFSYLVWNRLLFLALLFKDGQNINQVTVSHSVDSLLHFTPLYPPYPLLRLGYTGRLFMRAMHSVPIGGLAI